MKISIIIPVYNTEQYVEKCILSCLNQDLPANEFEIIVVNDGTRDNSMGIVRAIAAQNANLKIYEQQNAGLSVARNVGLSKACGKYIWFVDSDDWIEPNCLRRLVDRLDKDNLDGLVHIGIQYANDVYTPFPNVEYSDIVMTGKEYMSKHHVNCAAVKTIYRKDFLIQNKLSFYKGIYHEDHEFTPRAYYFIDRIEIANEHVYYNRVNLSSITKKPNPKKAFDLIIVARNLHAFMQMHDMRGVEKSFNTFIASALNESLNNCSYMSNDEKDALNTQFKKHYYLLESYIRSKSIKYKLEGFLFKIFPKHIIHTYSFVKRITIG